MAAEGVHPPSDRTVGQSARIAFDGLLPSIRLDHDPDTPSAIGGGTSGAASIWMAVAYREDFDAVSGSTVPYVDLFHLAGDPEGLSIVEDGALAIQSGVWDTSHNILVNTTTTPSRWGFGTNVWPDIGASAEASHPSGVNATESTSASMSGLVFGRDITHPQIVAVPTEGLSLYVLGATDAPSDGHVHSILITSTFVSVAGGLS